MYFHEQTNKQKDSKKNLVQNLELIQMSSNHTMAVLKICNQIHNTVEKSGLHYNINQTPFSSYITIKKKLLNPEGEGGETNDKIGGKNSK